MNAKKIFRALAALTFAVCIIFTLSSCDALGDILDSLPLPGQQGCAHTMEETAAKSATCEEAGNIQYFTCSTCNKVYLDEAGTTETSLEETVISAKGHKETTLAAKAPTCTAAGLTAGKKCSVCDEIIVAQTAVDALGHTEVDVAALAPTCTEAGLTAGKKCSVCNAYTVEQETIAALGHTMVDVEALAPTCNTDGHNAHKACTVCAYTENKQVIDELSHNVVGEANLPATCTKDGFIGGKYCSLCGEVFFAQKIVPALGHDNVVIDVVEAGCSGDGLQFVSCKRCGLEENVIVPEFHDVVEVAAKQVTCFNDGNTAYKYCKLCDWTEGKEIFIGGHKGEWVSLDACYDRLICTVCERSIMREQSTVIDFEGGAIYDDGGRLTANVGALTGAAGDAIVGGAAGLDAFGNPRTQYSIVTDAGNKVLKVVHNHNADYAASYTYLSYTDSANTATDGKYLVFDFDLKLNGVLNSGTPTIFTVGIYDASGNAATALSVNCYGGSENLKIAGVNVTAKTDGKVGDKATMWVSFRIVTTLDDTNASGRYSTATEIYAKAKDSDGPYKYITRVTKSTGACGGLNSDYSVRFTHDTNFSSSTQKTINYYLDNLSFIRTSDTNYLYSACDHALSDWSITEAVKCKTDGKATRSCTVDGCGYIETECLPAHKLTITPAKAATCAEAGCTMGEKCSECDYEIASTPIAKLAHTEGDEATCTTAKTCTVCGEELVAALGHTEVTDAAEAATCTTAGKTEGKHCSVCNEIIVEQTVVDALGHDLDDGVYIIVPNCTESGTVKYTCKRNCGHSVIEEITSAHDIVTVPGKDATCYEDGYTAAESCRLCDYTKESVVIPGGHKGEWVPIDAEYEQLACSVCNRVVRREKNNVIPSVVFPPADPTVKTTKIDFTDVLHATKATDDGGKYIVFDFDVLIDKSAASGTTEYLFCVWIMDGADRTAGNNKIASFQFRMKSDVVTILGDGVAVNDLPFDTPKGETYLSIRVVTELDTTSTASPYTSNHYVYVKEAGAEGPMTLVRTYTRSSSYGNVSRYDNYAAVLYKEASADYVLDVANASLIRTNDANYLYSDCDHVFGDWTVEKDAVKCDTDGVATRFCTVDGCGYTETEYISSHNLTTTSGKAATCLEAGYTAYSVCADCGVMIGKLDLPTLGHVISDWVDIEGGAKQKKTCQNGCGYYEIRTVSEDNPVTFDDGTVTDGGRLSYVNVNFGEDNKTAVSLDEKSNYSISNGVVSTTNSLCVYTKNNGTGDRHAKVSIPVTDGTVGNVYTFDFDMYIVPDISSSNNTSRIAASVIFGGASYSIGTYGSNVGAYTSNKGEYGKINTWIGFRFIYTVMVDGEAALEILVRDANGVYNTVRTTTVKSGAIKVSGVDVITISSYSSSNGIFTYYLDNLSFTRHTAGYESVD